MGNGALNKSVQSQFWSTSGCGIDVDKTLEMDNAKQLMEVQRRKVKRTEVNCQGKSREGKAPSCSVDKVILQQCGKEQENEECGRAPPSGSSTKWSEWARPLQSKVVTVLSCSASNFCISCAILREPFQFVCLRTLNKWHHSVYALTAAVFPQGHLTFFLVAPVSRSRLFTAEKVHIIRIFCSI